MSTRWALFLWVLCQLGPGAHMQTPAAAAAALPPRLTSSWMRRLSQPERVHAGFLAGGAPWC